MKFWGHKITFEIMENGDIGMFRDEEKRPMYVGESFDNVMNGARLFIGDILIKKALKE